MLHFLDDKNLVDGEREELNKILFQQNQDRSQCEFPFELNVPLVAKIEKNNETNGGSSINNIISNESAANSSSNYYQPKTTNLPVFLPNVGASTSSLGVGGYVTNSHAQQTTANVYLNHGSQASRTNLHRPNFIPAAISPYYIGLSYASPQYIVPTVRNTAAVSVAAVPSPFVSFVPVPPAHQIQSPVKYVEPEKILFIDTPPQSALNEKIHVDFTSSPDKSNSAPESNLSVEFSETNLNDDGNISDAVVDETSPELAQLVTDDNACDKEETISFVSNDDANRDFTRKVHFPDDNEQKSSSSTIDETKNSSPNENLDADDKKSDDAVASSTTTTTTKSWASLFKNSNAVAVAKPSLDAEPSKYAVDSDAQATSGYKSFGMVRTNDDGFVVAPTSADHDPDALKLGNYLKSCSLIHRGPAFQLRGLINKGSWCYVNATLQALMVCPPFVHLLRQMKFMTVRTPTSTPMLDSLVKFVGEFAEKFPRKIAQDLDKGAPFEPNYVYNVLKVVRRDTSFRGRQEDAEEFLSLVLNRLHEEMLSCLAIVDKSNMADEFAQTNKMDDDEWHQVGHKQKASLTRTSKLSTTPVSEIFSGVFRNSILHLSSGSKETVNLESFFTLPLNVQSPEITSISSAFQFMNKEIFKTSKNNKEIDTTRRTTFQELPVVLILHLKFFVYTDEGVKKIVKPILYGMDLQMDWNLLSPASNSAKLDKFNRTYKLFAVVFHHGEKAEGGHYTADVFHGGFWINVDDSKVYPVDDGHVLGFQQSRVPYLLFYRRCDSFADARNSAN